MATLPSSAARVTLWEFPAKSCGLRQQDWSCDQRFQSERKFQSSSTTRMGKSRHTFVHITWEDSSWKAHRDWLCRVDIERKQRGWGRQEHPHSALTHFLNIARNLAVGDRKSVVWGKRGSVSVDLGGRR